MWPDYHGGGETPVPRSFTLAVDPRSLRSDASALRMELCQPPQALEYSYLAHERKRGWTSWEAMDRDVSALVYCGQPLGEYFRLATHTDSRLSISHCSAHWAQWEAEPGTSSCATKFVNWDKVTWVFHV